MPRERPSSGPTDQTVAERIRFYRELRGLTVPALANRIRTETGHTYLRTVLTKMEAGTRRISVHDLVALAAGLQVTPTDLLMPRVGDQRATISTSAAPYPITAELYHQWLHQGGAGPTGTLAGDVTPLDPMTHYRRLLEQRAQQDDAFQRQTHQPTERG